MPEPSFELLIGDAREQLRRLQEDSIHCCVTSPPYWQLRDYGTPPQEWADGWVGELGQEPHPDQFVAHLVEVFEEVRRVLRPDGVCFVNIDDSYVGGGGNYGNGLSNKVDGAHPTNVKNRREFIEEAGVKPKELALVPARLSLALQKAGWWIRCDTVWSKPNGMPESVTDRPTRSHEYVFMLTKSPRYFWDREAVREATAESSSRRLSQNITAQEGSSRAHAGGKTNGNMKAVGLPDVRNLRSVWQIPTESFSDAHYAVMAKKLVERCIRAATSERGCCAECGAPVVRVVETTSLDRPDLPPDHPEYRPSRYDDGKAGDAQSPGAGQRFSSSRTVGWEPGCECAAEAVPCVVLDPFGGACTTSLIAKRLGRSSVAVELSAEFAAMGERRMETWWKDVTPLRVVVDESQLSLESV